MSWQRSISMGVALLGACGCRHEPSQLALRPERDEAPFGTIPEGGFQLILDRTADAVPVVIPGSMTVRCIRVSFPNGQGGWCTYIILPRLKAFCRVQLELLGPLSYGSNPLTAYAYGQLGTEGEARAEIASRSVMPRDQIEEEFLIPLAIAAEILRLADSPPLGREERTRLARQWDDQNLAPRLYLIDLR